MDCRIVEKVSRLPSQLNRRREGGAGRKQQCSQKKGEQDQEELQQQQQGEKDEPEEDQEQQQQGEQKEEEEEEEEVQKEEQQREQAARQAAAAAAALPAAGVGMVETWQKWCEQAPLPSAHGTACGEVEAGQCHPPEDTNVQISSARSRHVVCKALHQEHPQRVSILTR